MVVIVSHHHDHYLYPHHHCYHLNARGIYGHGLFNETCRFSHRLNSTEKREHTEWQNSRSILLPTDVDS